ncbi:MAG TPA: polysaccharide deacetylase family protein [Candidatus Dormibacteraeota bacterium]|nr:polysaccharide deacetylase family protein [Candidatus Dormibacteraeota bacterium]
MTTGPTELAGAILRRPPLSGFAFGRSDLTILTYHHSTTEGLRCQLEYIRSTGLQFVDLADLVSSQGIAKPTRPSVALTFDDGYVDCYTIAFPILRAMGVPATFFLVGERMADRRPYWWDRLDRTIAAAAVASVTLLGRTFDLTQPLGRSGLRTAFAAIARKMATDDADRQLDLLADSLGVARDLPGRPILDWEMVHKMRTAGMGFGSHTLTHPSLGALPIQDVQRELLESRLVLSSQLQNEVRLLAYPYGSLSEIGGEAPVLARDCGYWAGLTSVPRVGAVESSTMMPRITVNPSDNPDVLAFKMTALWPLAIRMRSAWAS